MTIKTKKTIVDFLEIAKEWHPIKNGTLTPDDLSYGSNKKVWWQCSKNHEWEARFSDRIIQKTNCPYCSNKKVCGDNCLLTTHPELAKEWHPNKNGNLTPNDVVAGNDKKVWWKCSKNHEWEASCDKRTKARGCPYCSNKKVCGDNCLLTTHPELAKEWHPIKNGELTPNKVVAGSNKKVWWICSKGHEWAVNCTTRTCSKNNCPYCTNQKVCGDNCLLTTHPELAKEWHPNKNGNLTPNDVVAGSNKKVWWICSKGHEYESSMTHRAAMKSGCPYCANQKVCKDNCLLTTHPDIAKEWHPNKNGNLTPNDVFGGSGKKFLWVCDKGHEYKTSPHSRTNSKTNCPICNESKGEKIINKFLSKNKIPFKSQFKFESCKYINYLPFDFAVRIKNELKLIEYQGQHHYRVVTFGASIQKAKENFKSIKKRDKIKKKWCLKNNIHLLEIPYWEFDNIESILENFLN